jgi:hypothetical protein
MKNFAFCFLFIFIGILVFSGCKKKDDDNGDLSTQPPTEDLIRQALVGFQYEAGPASLNEAKNMIDYMGGTFLFEQTYPEGGAMACGMWGSGYEIALWTMTYGKTDRYGVRYGLPDNDHGYMSSNATYFEIIKPDNPGGSLSDISKLIFDYVIVSSTGSEHWLMNLEFDYDAKGRLAKVQNKFEGNYGYANIISTYTYNNIDDFSLIHMQLEGSDQYSTYNISYLNGRISKIKYQHFGQDFPRLREYTNFTYTGEPFQDGTIHYTCNYHVTTYTYEADYDQEFLLEYANGNLIRYEQIDSSKNDTKGNLSYNVDIIVNTFEYDNMNNPFLRCSDALQWAQLIPDPLRDDVIYTFSNVQQLPNRNNVIKVIDTRTHKPVGEPPVETTIVYQFEHLYDEFGYPLTTTRTDDDEVLPYYSKHEISIEY